MKPNSPYELLRIKDYRNFLSSRFLIFVGLEMQFIVIGWILYDMTKDPLTLGIVGLCEALPALLITPFGGHFADRHDRRTIIKWAFSALFISTVVLVVTAFSMSTLDQSVAIAIIYGVVIIQGCGRGFAGPAIMALAVQLVPRDKLPQSTAFNSSTWQLGNIIGPAIGGLVFAFSDAPTTFLLATIILGISLVLMLKVPSYAIDRKDQRESFKTSFFEGWRFVKGNQLVLAPIALDMFAVLFGGAVALLPVFAQDILNVGPMGLGILRTAPSIGALAMGFFLAHNPMTGKLGTKLLWAVIGFGGAMIVFAISENVFLSYAALMLGGSFDNISVIIRSQVIQLMTPDSMRGRVSAVDSMFIISSNEIGAFESGFAAKLMGTVPSVIFGGVMSIVTVVATSILAPKLRRATFEDLQEMRTQK